MSAVDAILTLLEDHDPVVQESLAQRLGQDLPLLERTWTAACARGRPAMALIDLVLATDGEDLIQDFHQAEDLEAGVWILSQLDLPRLDYDRSGRTMIDALASRLPTRADAMDVARFLCQECGFSGNRMDYHSPLNSYMHTVLERRLGLPILLTALWMLIGRRLGLSIEAVAPPCHVLGRWRGGYIDLFQGGELVEASEVLHRVRALGVGDPESFLVPADDRTLLRRMARNLVNCHSRLGDRLRATIAHGMAGL